VKRETILKRRIWQLIKNQKIASTSSIQRFGSSFPVQLKSRTPAGIKKEGENVKT
jgi:hypothetical protein